MSQEKPHKFRIGQVVRMRSTGKYFRITALTPTGYKGREVRRIIPVVCESCLDSAREECDDYGLNPAEVARQLGNEIPDHLCEARDHGRSCDCRCNTN